MPIIPLLPVDSRSFRAAAIERIVYYLRKEDRKRAGLWLKYFQKRGERVSHEISAAYDHLTHGCHALFQGLSLH